MFSEMLDGADALEQLMDKQKYLLMGISHLSLDITSFKA